MCKHIVLNLYMLYILRTGVRNISDGLSIHRASIASLGKKCMHCADCGMLAKVSEALFQVTGARTRDLYAR